MSQVVEQQKDPLTLIHGDALSSLHTLESESVQCCVTSPPYWGLRDYGVDRIIWDETGECDHQWGDSITVNATNHTDKRRWNHTRNGRDELQPTEKRVAWLRTVVDQGNFCQVCGAWRGSLGLEPTPEMYVSHIVQIFHELKRSLRTDGTLWLNLGDSYATGAGSGRSMGGDCFGKQNPVIDSAAYPKNQPNRMPIPGLKPKDLIGIPWRVAFALQADGWYLRSDIIWSKPNPMPESVTDRPTRAHEYIFLLSRAQRYFYDAEAIKEEGSINMPWSESSNGGAKAALIRQDGNNNSALGKPARRTDKQRGHSRRHAGFNDRWDAMEREQQCSGLRNKRSVWEIATRPFPDAHFATFPIDLVTPCILAGSKAGDAVLDPFAGTFTTCKVAIELGRKAIGIEPKAEYVEMGKRRCRTTIGLPFGVDQPAADLQSPSDVPLSAQNELEQEGLIQSH